MPAKTPKLHNQHLNYLHSHWEPLRASLTPGTPAPTAALDPWVQKQAPGPGHSPAPLNIDTLDLLLDTQADTHAWLEQAGATPTGRMPEPLTQLDTLLHLARRKTGTWATGVRTWAENTAHTIRTRLDGPQAGQTLKACCPICGTSNSLRVRVLEAGAHSEPYLACESGICVPPANYCGNFLGATPVWPMHEWEWFATLLETQQRAVG